VRGSELPYPADKLLRIPVLAALQAVEYGAQHLVSRGLVLFKGLCFAGESGDAPGEPRATLRGEYAPAQEAVRAF
jgi:hypothetical protein